MISPSPANGKSAIPAVLQTYIEGLKTHDVDLIADTVADDLAFVSSRATLSKQQFLAMLRALYIGFPDWHYDHEAPEQCGDMIAVRWQQCGTHLGTLALPGMTPIPATGTKVTIPKQYFYYKVDAGRIIGIRPEVIPGGAPGGILQQLGVAVPPI